MRTAQEDFSLWRDLELCARRGDTHCAELDTIRHAGGQSAIFGLAVDFAHVDAQRAVPFYQIRRDRRGACAGVTYAMHANAALDVVEDKKIGNAVQNCQDGRRLVALELAFRNLEADAQRPGVREAANPDRLFHADGDVGIEAFPDARHCEEQGRSDLTHIFRDRLNTLCEISDGARSQWEEGSESALGDMA